MYLTGAWMHWSNCVDPHPPFSIRWCPRGAHRELLARLDASPVHLASRAQPCGRMVRCNGAGMGVLSRSAAYWL